MNAIDSAYGTRNGHAYLNGVPTTVRIPVTELQAGDVLAESGKVVSRVNVAGEQTVVHTQNGYYALLYTSASPVLIIK